MSIRGIDDFTVRCPACGGFIVMRLGAQHCIDCEWQRSTARDVEDLTEVRKSAEPFTPPRTWKPRS